MTTTTATSRTTTKTTDINHRRETQVSKTKKQPRVRLTLAKVKENARRAYDENRLTAQHGGSCVYRDDRGHVCAIGASVPESVATALTSEQQASTVSMLAGDVFIVGKRELPLIREIQAAHDSWTSRSSTSVSKRTQRSRLLKLIDHPSAQEA